MYTEQDLINISAIYQSCCDGDREKTIKVYEALYGNKPSDYIITKAIFLASKNGKQLESKPVAAKHNKLIDCKFSEDSVEVKEEVDCYEVESSVNTEQSIQYLDTGTDVNKVIISGTSTGLDTKLKLVPVVYTTRLNDMNIFKEDLYSLTVNGIMQAVDAESKPLMKKKAVVPSEIRTSNSLTYDSLVDKVDHYNILATSVDFGDNQIAINSRAHEFDHKPTEKELLGLCTPLRVGLTDCKIKCKHCYVKVNIKSPTVFKIKKCRNCKIDTDNHCVKKINNDNVTNNENFFLKRQDVILWNNTLSRLEYVSNIVMKNLYSNTTDIYIIYNSRALLKSYFHIDHVIHSDTEIRKYIKSNYIVDCISCCWHNRFKKLKKLWINFEFNSPPLLLLEPHLCPHNDCKCCCDPIKSKNNNRKNVTENNDIPMDSELEVPETGVEIFRVEPQKYQSVYSQLLCTTNGVETNSWINKALQYSKKLHPKIKAEVAESVSYQDIFAIQIESSKYLEHYTVRNGKIDSYFEINHLSSEPYPSQLISYEKLIKGSGCCWLSREKFLSSELLIFLKTPDYFVNDTHDIVFFLKRPHLCPVGDCSCCCKFSTENSESTKIEPFELPTVIKDSGKYKSKHVQSLKFYKKINNNSTLHSEAKRKIDACFKEFSIQKCKPIIIRKLIKTSERNEETITASNRFANKVPQILKKTDLSVPLLPKQVDDSLLLSSLVQNPVIQPPAAHDSVIQDRIVKTLIANVLERFKNIRLTLNSEGKVVAELDTPATNLSTAELEILSNILTHAQEQVELLGIVNHVTENLHAGMVNPSIPNLPVLENINTTATNSLFSSESVPANQNLNYDNNLTTPRNIPANTYVDTLTSIRSANEENTNNNNKNVSSNLILQGRKKMESTVDSSTDLYQAFSSLTYFKREQYSQSFSKLTYQKNLQYKRSFQSQKSQRTNNETSPFGMRIKDVYCLKSHSTASQPQSDWAKRRPQNKRVTNATNNSTAKRIRVTSPTRLTGTGDASKPQTFSSLRSIRYKHPSNNQSNFSQPISIPAESVLSTSPSIPPPSNFLELPFQTDKMLIEKLSTPERMIFNGPQGASTSSSDILEDDDDNCILGV